MHPFLEYMAAILVLMLAVSSAFITLGNMQSVGLQQLSEDQLQVIADRALVKITTTPGWPVDWGSNLSVLGNQVADFGLSVASGSSDTNELDLYKIERLASVTGNTSLIIDPLTVAAALGYYTTSPTTHWIFGFRLTMSPALFINITQPDIKVANYIINVTDSKGLPARDATLDVSTLQMALLPDGTLNVSNAGSSHGFTDWNGFYSVVTNFTATDLSTLLLAVKASYLGIKQVNATVAQTSGDAGITVTQVGTAMDVGFQDNGLPKATRWPQPFVIDILSGLTASTIPLSGGWKFVNQAGKSSTEYIKGELPGSTSACTVLPYCTPGSNCKVANHLKFVISCLGGGSIVFELDSGSPTNIGGIRSVVDSRMVVIGGLSYVLSLTIWRMSE